MRCAKKRILDSVIIPIEKNQESIVESEKTKKLVCMWMDDLFYTKMLQQQSQKMTLAKSLLCERQICSVADIKLFFQLYFLLDFVNSSVTFSSLKRI